MATPLNDVYSLRAATDAELHIAVVHGPHAGMVLPASAATLGRADLPDDQFVSWQHLRLRQLRGALRVRDVGSVNGLWLRCGGCFWRRRRRLVWYPRARIRIGTTVLQLRRLPRQLQVPQPHAGGFLLQSLYVLLPLVAMAGFLLTDQGWSMMLISAPMLGLMMLRSYPSGRGATPGRLPDPATLALACAMVGEHKPNTKNYLRAWPGIRRFHATRIRPDERITITGPNAQATGRWLCAQLLATSQAQVQPVDGGAHLVWDEGKNQAWLMWATAKPATRCIHAPRRVAEISDSWWHQIFAPTTLSASQERQGPACIALASLLDLEAGPTFASQLQEPKATAKFTQADPSACAKSPTQLRACLGVGAVGQAWVDLVADGPHALVVGTTGAGKSELLTSWLLQLAWSQPPEALQLILVDYKGGTCLGPLKRLPHCVDLLTDLEPAATARAIEAISAQLRRREQILRKSNCKDITEYEQLRHHQLSLAPLARMLVVVDEFATLAATQEELLEHLLRLAAQGRSLGMHLILATQHPHGALSTSITANAALRVCLRMLDASEGAPLLGHGDLPDLPRAPGFLCLSTQRGHFRCPYAGTAQESAVWIDACVKAAQALPPCQSPWLAPPPANLSFNQARQLLTAHGAPAPAKGLATTLVSTRQNLALALCDLPEQLAYGAFNWDSATPLGIFGTSASGRTAALRQLASSAAQAGLVTHTIGADLNQLALPNAALAGSQLDTFHPCEVLRLTQLALEGKLRGQLLLIDDLDCVGEAIDTVLGLGEGRDVLEKLVNASRRGLFALALAGDLANAPMRWCTNISQRLYLGVCSDTLADQAGLKRCQQTPNQVGAGVLTLASHWCAAQILLAPVLPTSAANLPASVVDSPASASDLPVNPSDTTTALATAPVVALPEIVPTCPPWALGLGGDQAQPWCPQLSQGLVIIGPAGSGRSTALARVYDILQATDPALAQRAIFIDNLDQACPSAINTVETALDAGIPVFATALTSRAANTYSGALSQLRSLSPLLLLAPGLGEGTQLANVRLTRWLDPHRQHLPGRGLVIASSQITPIQICQNTSPTFADNPQV
ncbi:FHA domain-containing protein [Actinomyces graevenitzii]|uniref:FHA domain-containing protein n=1 Tax=Actinomyces graevenitzii TaxID=55565 RepID=UPI0003FCF367|nr:FHA domain-containing protein [Actinomyces graevenitzii]